MSAFNPKIKQAIEIVGSQANLASGCNVAQPTVFKWLNGGEYSSGYLAGNKARQYTLDVLMPRVDRVLAQYSHIVAITDPLHTQFYLDTLERPSGENGFVQSHRKPLYLYTKKEIDKLFAVPLATFFTQCLEEFATENMGKVAEDKMLAYFCKLYRKIGKYCADLWLLA